MTIENMIRSARQRLQISRRWLVGSQQAICADAIPFLDPIDEICEEAAPRFVGSTHYFVVGLFLSLLLVASVVHVETVVVGTGRLTTDTPSIMLQPLERSIIREVKVKPGEAVTKGQVLATLDATFTQADLASLSSQERSLLAQVNRIEAELNDRPFEAGMSVNADDLLQTTLYEQRRSQYKSRLRVFDQEIQRLTANIRTTEDDRASLAKQLALAKDVQEMRGALLQRESGSKLQFLDSQSARMRIERDYQGAVNRLLELQHGVESKEAERQTFIDEWRQQLLESLVTARNDAAKVNDGMAKASRMNDLVVLSAPEDGVVLDIAKRSVGSVLREAEPLMTIVPSKASLIAEIMIGSGDIGYAKPGDEVVIKVDAFPYQRHGLMHGRLLSISEESFPANGGSGQDAIANGGSGGAFHRGRVEIVDTHLDRMPEGARVTPGMTLSAEIKVGSRSIISYFLNPLTRGLRESFREP